ncbi:follistatin-related protein 5-like [Haliotis rufescens]|uniref:follistatin-related protein 5-like n=1 Tax=Haliotis rufescens TaxID=6454 RepID=UPI00201F8F46|nr:follistatin-related protein 5-like [Haliotis rufescens]XP_046379580.2 follistatin-related protein 5-like [Haliotis rufescens]
MELVKRYILLFLCCGLLSFIEARPRKTLEKKKAVKNWWDEDWSQWFGGDNQDSKLSENHVADSQHNKDTEAAAQAVKPKDIVAPPAPLKSKGDSVKPLAKHQQPQQHLYNPTEEKGWDDKYDVDYNKFVDDDDDVDYGKDYDDIEDEEEEDLDSSEEDYTDSSEEASEEAVEEKDYKEIDEMKAKTEAPKVQVNMVNKEPDHVQKETTFRSYGNDMAIVPVEKHADEKQQLAEQKEVSKEMMLDTFPDVNTHSVKKDLMNPAYLKEYAKTKPDLKTSPNPPPPGLVDGKMTMVTPSGKKPVKEEKTYIQSKPLALCQSNSDCRVGRMCHDKVCVCLSIEGCQGHYKPVCGSDNNWYPSHCELHRSACVSGEHIKIDHTGICFKIKEKLDKEQAEAQVKVKENTEAPSIDRSEIDIDNDIPQDAIKSPIINSAEIYDYPKTSAKGQPLKQTEKPVYKEDVQVKANLMLEDGEKSVEGKGIQRKKDCTREEYEKFKQSLLQYHCEKFTEPNCPTEVQEEREYLATLMFSFYDRDLDFYLEDAEAREMEEKEHYERLSDACILSDMIPYADRNPVDGKLSVSEFIAAFNGSMKVKKLQQDMKVIPTLATVGNGLELKCSVSGAEEIVWKRFSTDIRELNNDELTVFEDGSLFFSKVGVHHMGNYTCEDINNPLVQQIHNLKVQMPPLVRISPSSQLMQSNSDVVIKCHAEGVPKPKISWEVNEMSIPDTPNHFVRTHENGTLTVHKADYLRDTGAYKCIANNQAGRSDDVASIFIQNPNKTNSYSYSQKSYGSFIVFHHKGYTVYEPETCLLQRDVTPEFGNFKFIPDNIDAPLKMCDSATGCEWGAVTNVKDFVYVSQPRLNRVIVVDTARKLNPIQVIDTDKAPMALHYVEHLDQVWALCWNSETDSSLKTIIVIRDASKYIQHHAVHTQPVGNRFDMVQDLFLAPTNDLHHAFNYGYITHNGQQGLFKLDLKTMKYVKAIDFSSYNCVPKSVSFVPIGGHVIVQCVSKSTHETIQLLMDYLTDTIISKTAIPGKPFVAPDSKHIVTVDDFYGKVSVLTVSDDGNLESEFEVTLSCSISDVAFFSSAVHPGYDVVMTSADDDDIFFLSLTNGKLDKVKGSSLTDRDWKPQPLKKTLVAGGVFSNFLLSSLPTSIRIINGELHQVQCTFKGPVNSHVIAFIEN